MSKVEGEGGPIDPLPLRLHVTIFSSRLLGLTNSSSNKNNNINNNNNNNNNNNDNNNNLRRTCHAPREDWNSNKA